MTKPLNVLLITTDQQRFDALGANGNPHVQTPHLDRLARRSVNLQSHYTSSPLCTPARSSMLTGLYPGAHGAYGVGDTLPRQTEGLAHWLGAAGYRCGLFGKAHFEPELSEYVLALDDRESYRGFHETQITEDNLIGPYLDWVKREHPQHLASALELRNEGLFKPNRYGVTDGRLDGCYVVDLPEDVHPTAWIAGRTLDFIDRCGPQPFFAWSSFVDPHHPWTPIEPYASLYDPAALPGPKRRPGENEGIGTSYLHADGLSDAEYQRIGAAYYAMITQLDAQVGRILDFLEERRLLDNTLIIFTSDHGEYNGDHGLIRKGFPWYDSLLRVPMLVSAPGCDAGQCANAPTQHEDIAPTVLEMLGLPVPQKVEGRSFCPVLRGDERAARDFVYFEGRWPGIAAAYGIQRDLLKLIHYPTKAGWVLSDLAEDPDEYENRTGQPGYAGPEKELRDGLLDWIVQKRSYCAPRAYPW